MKKVRPQRALVSKAIQSRESVPYTGHWLVSLQCQAGNAAVTDIVLNQKSTQMGSPLPLQRQLGMLRDLGSVSDQEIADAYIGGQLGGQQARAEIRERIIRYVDQEDTTAIRLLLVVADRHRGPIRGDMLDRKSWIASLLSSSLASIRSAQQTGTAVRGLVPTASVPAGTILTTSELTHAQRTALSIHLVSRLGSAETHFVAALGQEREAIEDGADREGELLKLIVNSAFTYFITPGIGRALSRLAGTFAINASLTSYRLALSLQSNASSVAGSISSIAKPLAISALQQAGRPPTQYTEISQRLATAFSVGKDHLVGHVANNIQNHDSLPDEDLLLFMAAWDPQVRTQSVFAKGLRSVLREYREQVLRIGERRTTAVTTFAAMGTRRSIRWVQTGNSRQLAAVSVSYPGSLTDFVSWIDPLFEQAAINRWQREPVRRNAYGGRVPGIEPQTVAPGDIGAPVIR